jgi:uncharacterized protein YbaR (Trm112 family)
LKEKLLTYLVCPSCAGKLSLSVKETQDGEIITGELGCDSCSRMFPILRGVPRFSDLETVASDKQETAENFGWQWTHFTQEDTRYADQFLGWLQPVT